MGHQILSIVHVLRFGLEPVKMIWAISKIDHHPMNKKIHSGHSSDFHVLVQRMVRIVGIDHCCFFLGSASRKDYRGRLCCAR